MQFDLYDGRSVSLVSLAKTLTYDGLLEGGPTLATNKSRVRAAAMKGPSHLLDRRLDRYNCVPEINDNFERDQRLPPVVCHATLRSHQPIHDVEAHGSELLVAWYQDDFATPIQSYAVDMILRLEWAALATDNRH